MKFLMPWLLILSRPLIMREKSSHLSPSKFHLDKSNVKNHGSVTEASALEEKVLRMCSNKGRALVLAKSQAALSTTLA